MSNLSSGKNIKKRNWALVLYPESAPADWLEQLQNTGLQGCISPLHDKDVDPTGEPKKAHYHIILCYSGPTSFSVVNALCVALHQPHPVPLEQIRGYYRYLTHKDNPDKYQYDERDIKPFNGFNISDYCELTRSEVIDLIKRVHTTILDADIIEYSDLLDFLLGSGMIAEYEVAVSHTLLFGTYITSRRNKALGVNVPNRDRSD